MKNCQKCAFGLLGTENYCPNCGQNIKEMILSTSVRSQIWLYLTSIFLFPFGLGKTFRYIRLENSRAKIIGWVSLAITLTALLFGIWRINVLIQGIVQQLNQGVGVGGLAL